MAVSVVDDVKTGSGLLLLAALFVVSYWSVGFDVEPRHVEPGPISAPDGVYDPIKSGEATPPGFRQLLPRDAIAPVYNPTFTSAVSTGWDDETLVIGLALDGEAKAYPVSFLNRREMVIDWIAGTPVLVSW